MSIVSERNRDSDDSVILGEDYSEQDSQVENERNQAIQSKIEEWRELNAKLGLCDKVKKKVEDSMRNKVDKHSEIYIFLNYMADKADRLWPAGERIPFF